MSRKPAKKPTPEAETADVVELGAERPKLSTRIDTLGLSDVVFLEKNARYMNASQQQRLNDNIAADGVMTSLPLVWLQHDDVTETPNEPAAYLILSGNHRTRGAIAAGLDDAQFIIIDQYLSPSRRIEIQLAHNAIGGQDDIGILGELYSGLDLDGKLYSGLTDDVFGGFDDLDLKGLSVGQPQMKEVVINFLEDDHGTFHELLLRIEKKANVMFHTAHLDQFDRFFDGIVRAKDVCNVSNSAMAILALLEMAEYRMDEIVAEQKAAIEAGEIDAPKMKGIDGWGNSFGLDTPNMPEALK